MFAKMLGEGSGLFLFSEVRKTVDVATFAMKAQNVKLLV